MPACWDMCVFLHLQPFSVGIRVLRPTDVGKCSAGRWTLVLSTGVMTVTPSRETSPEHVDRTVSGLEVCRLVNVS